MRIDHIAYRTKDRVATSKFFCDALGYKIQQEFSISFDDGSTAQCIALEPPEKPRKNFPIPWTLSREFIDDNKTIAKNDYHLAPELFVSDGPPESIVGYWVTSRNGIGGIHHVAYQVNSVSKIMEEWKAKGYAEFSSDEPMRCPEDNLVQVFTKPIIAMGGIIVEFIERGEHGFCAENVKNLMEATKNL